MLPAMTEEHLTALLTLAEAKKDDKGFMRAGEGRSFTLYVASGAAGLTVSRIDALKLEKHLLYAQTTRNETFVLALEDVYAGSIEQSSGSGRKAGFVP
ncbi:MAG: hypothetical protein DIU78_012260 [Pseudomonadota bacterium]|nr:MAG: hypothetical protein DIU78_01815 [Pseudomonadota bacterium]